MKAYSLTFIVVMIGMLYGCSTVTPVVKKVNESKSGFDGVFYQGDTEVLNEPPQGLEQYRIFEDGASGFVSAGALREDAELRAKDFCAESNKVMRVIKVQTSYARPWKPGGFPKAEVTFVCIEKLSADALYARLGKLKQLLDSGALTKDEFEREKARLLNATTGKQ